MTRCLNDGVDQYLNLLHKLLLPLKFLLPSSRNSAIAFMRMASNVIGNPFVHILVTDHSKISSISK